MIIASRQVAPGEYDPRCEHQDIAHLDFPSPDEEEYDYMTRREQTIAEIAGLSVKDLVELNKEHDRSFYTVQFDLPTPLRTDILDELDFHTGSVTEDFDLTIQIHRKKLGKIKYIPEAANYTQDPNTIKDYYSQTQRWYRGFFQGLHRYKVGLKPHRVDLSVIIQVADLLVLLFHILAISYILIFANQHAGYVKQFLIFDALVVSAIIIYATIATRRPILLLAIFYYHFMKIFELSIYIKAFLEVIVFKTFPRTNKKSVGWNVGNRRYKISEEAMADFA